MSKKFLIFIFMVFMISMGSISAHDVTDDTLAIDENQDMDILSTSVDDNMETTDVLQESNHARFNIDNDTAFWEISVLDDEDNPVTQGYVKVYIEKYSKNIAYNTLSDDYYTTCVALYEYYDYFPNDLLITYSGNYQVDDLTVPVDLKDSIVGEDIVDETSFSATFYDENGVPLKEERVSFHVSNGDYSYREDFYRVTDVNGIAGIDPALYIDNYTVRIENDVTGQSKKYWWNITKADDSKLVEIKASQLGGKLVVSAVDANGNNITAGEFIFTPEHGARIGMDIEDDSFVVLSLYEFDFDDFPQNITVNFKNYDYYNANKSVFVDALIDTIDGQDIVDEHSFSVTCYDDYGATLNEGDVTFKINAQDYSYWNELNVVSDENGIATINLALPIGNYSVFVMNDVTRQYKEYWWNITQTDKSKASWINVTLDEYSVVAHVLNMTNDTIDSGDLLIFINGEDYGYMYGPDFVIYGLGKGTYDVTFYYKNDEYYYDSNASVIADVIDTIIINESFYNTTEISLQILDYEGNPLSNAEIDFYVDKEDRWFEGYTDENGNLTFDFSLWPGKYDIDIYNWVSHQYKNVTLEIIEVDESKKALINVTRDGFKFTLNVSDINGNKIDGGKILVDLGFSYSYVEINNGTAIFIYNTDMWGIRETVNLTFVLYNSSYYPVNTSMEFEVVDTINSSDVLRESRFEATFFDMDGNPLVNKEVLFALYEDTYDSENVVNITKITDENGMAFIEKTDKPYEYYVVSTNLVTYQSKTNSWRNKDLIEITPIVDYIDNSTGKLYVSNNTVTFKVSPNATEDIYIFDQKGNYWNKSIENGSISFVLPLFGENPLELQYYGDEYYDYTNVDYVIVYYEKYAPNMTVSENLSVNYLDDANFTVNLKYGEDPIGNASIEIKIGNDTYELVTDEKGNAFIPIALDAGIYDVDVNYLGNQTYYPVNKNTLLTVNKIKPTMSINDTVIDCGDDLIVNIDINATGKITVEINGKKYESDIDNSVAAVDLSALTKGTYDAKIIYSGDNNYYNSTIDSKITLNPVKIDDFNVTAEPIIEGEVAEIEIQLPEDATGNVTANVNGKEYTVPVENGTATISIPDLAMGNYTIPISYSGDGKYDSLTANASVVVEEDTSDIIVAPELVKYYAAPDRFVVYVTDYKGNPLANKSVTISINGENYYRTTNANGTAGMAIRLNRGIYNVTITASNKTVTSLVTVLTTVNGTDIVKIFRNGTQYYATFRDSEGNYLKAGTEVRFNINGVMYDRKVSGDKGLAKLNINLNQGEYVITALNTVTGEENSNIITVISKIVENKDLTKYYRNASQYTVKILGDDGNPVGPGVNVTFNINGVFYTRTTNASGIAKLNINLQSGDYIITAECGGCMVSNNITVLSVLNASDLTKKYGTPDQFIATLVDGQGNPYGGEKIEFNINGIFYYRTTNSSGQAKLNINLQPGEYIITSTYAGLSISNMVTVIASE